MEVRESINRRPAMTITESVVAVTALVQFFNTVQVARETQVIKEVAAIADIFHLGIVHPDDWRKLIAEANRRFQFVHVSIRAMISEINGEIYWGLVNTADDDVTSVVFAEKEVKLFQAVLKALVDLKGCISAEQAVDLRCRAGQHKLDVYEAAALLKKLCATRWLKVDNDGNFLIGERSYLEYGAHFDQLHQAGQLPTCATCNRWVILSTDDGLHFHCKERVQRRE